MARHADFHDFVPACSSISQIPHSPWQRGTNQYTDGPLRRHFPKGTDLSLRTQGELNTVAAELNGRPRKAVNWRKQAEAFGELIEKHCVAMTD